MKKKRKKADWVSTLVLALVFVVGLGVLAYPTVSDWWNSTHQSRAIADYTNAVTQFGSAVVGRYLCGAHFKRDHNLRS